MPKTLLPALVAALLVPLVSPAWAQSGPAVESPNAKLSFGFSAAEEDAAGEGGFALGSVAVPLGHSFGAQVDLLVDDQENATDRFGASTGVALHLFARDPSRYLLGVYAHAIETDSIFGDIDATRYGIEGEYYLGDFTFSGFLGRDDLSGAGIDADFEAIELSAARYLGTMTEISFAGTRAFDNTDAAVGVEHMLGAGAGNMSLFGELGFGDSGTRLTAGVSVYLGSRGMSLRDIHRRNDPPTRMQAPGLIPFLESACAQPEISSLAIGQGGSDEVLGVRELDGQIMRKPQPTRREAGCGRREALLWLPEPDFEAR
ncbi:hypothetical protein [Jannaschia ovalis]|uniref:Porin n=1 Tax=Jannaschia ovalis TaxID=3038773 RepID=A0ABY8L7Y6_9RHOB|nr:hypothetical protein [Jannaschia sp. GRR-S6-38]WGH77484.1 hypothetical protein P8627_10565 [Jannaschia sp. GRR-S6-38]